MNIAINDVRCVLPKGGNALSSKEDEIIITDLFISGNKIAGIGEKPADFVAEETIDGHGFLCIPGLINAHTHAYMSFMRNTADDLSFMDWLFGRIDPMEQQMSNIDAYHGALLGIDEMLRSGTTCINDMQMNIHQTTRAVRESGIRAVISRGLVGSAVEKDGKLIIDEAGQTRLAEAFEEMKDGETCSRLTFRIGPHAPYTCNEESMKYFANVAKENSLGVHIHLSESVSEISQVQEKYGCSPIALAERTGLFDVPCVAAHCVQVDANDIDILKNKNVSVVSNPASNMKLGNGFAPIKEMVDKGVNVCIGTDGAASNNALNMFHEMNLMSLIHKGTHKTPECLSAQEIFRMATINGARALGLESEIGSIEVGKKADLVLLDLNNPSLQPINNLLAGLVYSANGSEVDTVIIDGEIILQHKKVLSFNEAEVFEQVNNTVKKMNLK